MAQILFSRGGSSMSCRFQTGRENLHQLVLEQETEHPRACQGISGPNAARMLAVRVNSGGKRGRLRLVLAQCEDERLRPNQDCVN
jgi:hypothetical protein